MFFEQVSSNKLWRERLVGSLLHIELNRNKTAVACRNVLCVMQRGFYLHVHIVENATRSSFRLLEVLVFGRNFPSDCVSRLF